MSKVIAFFKLIWKIAPIIWELWPFIKDLASTIDGVKRARRVSKKKDILKDTSKLLEKKDLTDEERSNAARAIADVFRL